MPALRQLCSLLLLTLLWMAGPSGANQQQPSAVSTALDPEQVLGIIVHEVTAKVESLISQLASQIERLDSRLINFDSRLTSVDSRLSGIESRLNILDLRQDTYDANLEDHSSRIESRLVPLISRINSTGARLDRLVSEVDSIDGKLDAGLVPLTARVISTEAILDQLASGVNSTVGKLSSRLDLLTSRMNFTDASLDELVSQINVTEDKLDSRVEELVSQINGTSAGQSDRLDDISSRLDDLANRTGNFHPPPRDCSGLPNGARSGIYQLRLDPSQPPVSAYCDLETDGGRWTVIQRRKDIEPRQDFNLNWNDYREGFGDLQGEFWWGLQSLWKLTGSEERQYELRVNLADFEGGRRYASYSRFSVGSEADGYRLTVSGYSGTAGDSLRGHNGRKFSTKDRDQDEDDKSCAQSFKGGWWFRKCYFSFLNGLYLSGNHDQKEGAVHWYHWRGFNYSLKDAEMKIRPV